VKIIRFGDPGRERSGVLLDDGTRVDVSDFGSDYDEAFFASGGLKALEAWLNPHVSSLPVILPDVRLGPPICRPSKIVCIGLNFRDHAAESRMELPGEPVVVALKKTSLAGPQ